MKNRNVIGFNINRPINHKSEISYGSDSRVFIVTSPKYKESGSINYIAHLYMKRDNGHREYIYEVDKRGEM